jgi:hypothetical protein
MFFFFCKILGVFYWIYYDLYRNRSRQLWNYRKDLETWGIFGLLDLVFSMNTRLMFLY